MTFKQTSTLSFFNVAQTYASPNLTRRVYNIASQSPPGVAPLTARIFGTWTLMSGVIRMYAAHNLSDPVIYQLALWTYAIALCHFGSELLVYRTTKVADGAIPVFIVAIMTVSWMLAQWGEYVK